MKRIDTELFRQIIESEGAEKVHTDEHDGLTLEYYMGTNGSIVGMCFTDEFIAENTAKGNLNTLVMGSLISRLPFEEPQQPVVVEVNEEYKNEKK